MLDIKSQIHVSIDKPKPELINSIEPVKSLNKKPSGGFWTSSKYYDGDMITSEWVEWAKGNLSRYDNKDMYVWELTVDNPCKVLKLNTKEDIIEHSQKYTDSFQNEHYDFDWKYIYTELDCDAIWLTETGVRNLCSILIKREYSMSSWDVESMLWSDWKFSNVEKVRKL